MQPSFDAVHVITALQFVVYASIPLLGAVLVGALVAGVLRVATQIEDTSISYVGRFAGVAILLYLTSDGLIKELISITARIWGGADFYH